MTMKRLRINDGFKWLKLIRNRLDDYITNNIISIAFYKAVSEDLEKFDEERWYSNSHSGLIA